MNNNTNKKTLSACIALFACSFSGISSAAYINETLGNNDSFTDAQFISDTYFTNKFDADIDYAIDSGGSFDSWIELYDSSFNLIANNDDSILDRGSNFSFSDFVPFSEDSFINYRVETDGLYYAVVGGNSSPSGIPFGSNYTLHITNGAIAIPPSFIPLPVSAWLLLSSLVGFTSISRRRKQ